MKRIISLLTAIAFNVAVVGLGATTGMAATSASDVAKSAENAVKENPGAAVGGGAGAATGAAAGAVIGKSAGAAVVGGLLGALAGGAIGHYAYDKRKDRQQTAQDLNFQPSKGGNMIKVENASASPQTVKPGSEVNLITTYGLLTRSQSETPVTETWEITHDGKVVGNPQVHVNRPDGTYQARIPLRLPENATPGVYNVRSTVKTASGSDTKTTQFRVG